MPDHGKISTSTRIALGLMALCSSIFLAFMYYSTGMSNEITVLKLSLLTVGMGDIFLAYVALTGKLPWN